MPLKLLRLLAGLLWLNLDLQLWLLLLLLLLRPVLPWLARNTHCIILVIVQHVAELGGHCRHCCCRRYLARPSLCPRPVTRKVVVVDVVGGGVVVVVVIGGGGGFGASINFRIPPDVFVVGRKPHPFAAGRYWWQFTLDPPKKKNKKKIIIIQTDSATNFVFCFFQIPGVSVTRQPAFAAGRLSE